MATTLQTAEIIIKDAEQKPATYRNDEARTSVLALAKDFVQCHKSNLRLKKQLKAWSGIHAENQRLAKELQRLKAA